MSRFPQPYRASMTSQKSQTKDKIYPDEIDLTNRLTLILRLKIPAVIAQPHWLLLLPLKNQNKNM